MRRILQVGLVLLAVALVAAAGLWLARIPIATAVLEDRLEQAGFSDARFRISELDWNRLRIETLRLDEAPAPEVERVSVRFRPLSLLRGDTRHLEISLIGVRARIEPGADGLAIAGLAEAEGDAAAGAPAGQEGGLLALAAAPTLHLRDTRIELESALGRWTADLDGDLESGPDGPASARIDWGVTNNRLRVEGAGSARYDGQRIAGSMRLRENDGFEIQLAGRVVDPLRAARARLEYRLDMPSAADLPWAFLPGAPPTAGRMQLAGSARGRIASAAIPQTPAGWLRGLLDGAWQGDYQATVEGLAMTARFDGLTLDAGGTWRAEDGRLSVATAGEGALRIERIAEPLWSRLSPPAAARPYVEGPVRVRWAAGDWLQVAATPQDGLGLSALPRFSVDWPGLSGQADVQASLRSVLGVDGSLGEIDLAEANLDVGDLRLDDLEIRRLAVVGGVENLLTAPAGELDISLDVPRWSGGEAGVRELTLRLPLRMETEQAGTRVSVRSPGRLEAAQVALPGGLRSDGAVGVAISDGIARFDEAPDYRLSLRTQPVRLVGDTTAAREVGLDAGLVRIEGDGRTGAVTAIQLEDFAGGVPAQDLRLEGIEARLRPLAAANWLRFSVERIRQMGDAARIAPVSVSGTLARRPDGLRLAGEGRLGDGAVPFKLSGEAAPDGGSGFVRAVVAPIQFRPDGVQPVDLAPPLAPIREVDGRAGGELVLTWNEAGVDGNLDARIEDMDLTAGLARIVGLRGEVRLDRLRPARTGAPQELVADHIDAGLRIEAPTLRFGVERLGGGGPGIHVIEARGRVVDGSVAVRDWRFDPLAQVYDPTVQVQGVALEKLLESLSIDGLEGSGSLSGALPVFVTADGFAVRDGRLRGLEGRIRYRSERADQVLAGADRSVEMMLRALRDFRYDQLEVGVNRELAGESRVDIRMEGRNPDVLEGHPFRFNIALTGDVEPLLEALAQGRELTDELIERHLRMRQGE